MNDFTHIKEISNPIKILSPIHEAIFVGICFHVEQVYPDSKVHGANMGPIWGRQDPGGPHVGPTNFAIKVFNINLICAAKPSSSLEFRHNFFDWAKKIVEKCSRACIDFYDIIR